MNIEQQTAFLDKLDKLCKESNVDLAFGCGCCGAGIYYKEGSIHKEFDNCMWVKEEELCEKKPPPRPHRPHLKDSLKRT